MATPGASAPWNATWQLNAGALQTPGDANIHTTAPSVGIEAGFSYQDNADLLPGNRALGAIEGEELRTIVETLEKMQAKDPEKAQEAVSYCRKGLEGDEKGERLRMLANMSAEWTEVFHAWEVHHGVSKLTALHLANGAALAGPTSKTAHGVKLIAVANGGLRACWKASELSSYHLLALRTDLSCP